MALSRHSEPFSPDGNLSAEGFENLLGTPSLDLLAVLVREAVQNSCDATRDEPGRAQIYLRIRTLTREQRKTLVDQVFKDLPPEQTASENLSKVLDEEGLQVLEIADYGTTGLGGPTRADLQTAPGENADFVNFFRNVGAARDVEGGGGTYGYGKATLYRASRAHAILVDTLTTDGGSSVRRFMAAQMGKAIPGLVTGRHWWGVVSSDGRTANPLTGKMAAGLASRLGMPARESAFEDRGSTIMILAPHLPTGPDQMIGVLTEYLLWYFWPRMMKTTPKRKILEAFVSNGVHDWTRVPTPESFPPIDLMCRAMNVLRGEDDISAETVNSLIQSQRPKADLGYLVRTTAKPGRRRWLLPPARISESEDDVVSMIPEKLHHVALMRPAQLVVRYETGSESADPEKEWGGVFMCAEDEEVENAFAKSEPPAHDDWQPESLPKRSRERSFVNVALKRIREQINFTGDHSGSAATTNSPLGKPSSVLGRLLPGSRVGGAGRRQGGIGDRARGNLFLTQPKAHGLGVTDEGKPVADFTFEVAADFLGCSIEASPAVVIDGHIREPDEATGYPEIIEWKSPDGSLFAAQTNLTPNVAGRWHVSVLIPGEVAVSIRLRELEEVADE